MKNRQATEVVAVVVVLLSVVISVRPVPTARAHSSFVSDCAPSIGDVLDDRGIIRPGAEGSFGGAGFRMSYDEHGAPTFTAVKEASTDQWSSEFSSNLLNDYVFAVAVSGPDIYVGGRFTNAGGKPEADYIARWDGSEWHALGAGVKGGNNSAVFSITLVGSDVYVGGSFSDAGGNADAGSIARWDGSDWHALGSGIRGTVYAIAISGSDVFVGGSFTGAGGSENADRIARWDGANWHALGTGIGGPYDGAITVIAIDDTYVYVGGRFDEAGGNLNARSIARWDGTEWHALGNGITGIVRAIAISGEDVYVGGRFTDAGGLADADYVVRWDGNDWNALAPGLDYEVSSIALIDEDIYVGGSFSEDGARGHSAGVARLDGATWDFIGSSLNGAVETIFPVGADMYVAGSFRTIARRTADDWEYVISPANGLNASVSAIAIDGSDVYVGGGFTQAGGHPEANHVARWDGDSWQPLGAGLNGSVQAIAVSGTDVFVGGNFTDAGGNDDADRIARWDGTEWHAMGEGLNDFVFAIAVHGSDVFVGGDFTDAGGNAGASHIARWNGESWHALDTGLNSTVLSIAAEGSDVYVGGDFTEAGGRTHANCIARWDGIQWHPLGSGLDCSRYNAVHAIGVSGSDVYVGGRFAGTGGDGLARWDGTSWRTFGVGIDGTVYAIATSGDNVYVGGTFFNAGSKDDADHIARWDGSEWHPLGTGLTHNGNAGTVMAIATTSTDVWAGGVFTRTGDESVGTAYIGRFEDSALSLSREVTEGRPDALLLAEPYPNPFVDRFRIRLLVPHAQQVHVTLYNALGQRVRTVYRGVLSPQAEHVLEIDGAGLPSGLYMIRAEGEHLATTRAIMLVR